MLLEWSFSAPSLPPPPLRRTNLGIMRNANWTLHSDAPALVDGPKAPVNRLVEGAQGSAALGGGGPDLAAVSSVPTSVLPAQGPASPFPASAFRLPFPVGEAGDAEEMEPRGSGLCLHLHGGRPSGVGPADFPRRVLRKSPLLRGKVFRSLGGWWW